MRAFVFAAACFWSAGAFVSCRSAQKPMSPSDLSPRQLEAMDHALEHVKSRKFLEAAAIYDDLARQLKGRPPEIMMLFNAGGNYREAGRCDLSVSRFQRLLERSLKNQAFKARGLFEISFSYECLGDHRASFLALKDAEGFKSSLPWEMSRLRLPARLGIAAARLKLKDQADNYKSLVLTAVLQSRGRHSSEADLIESLGRSFYLMGKFYTPESRLSAEAFLLAFPHHQGYLLQAVFLGGQWRQLAERELFLGFKKLRHAVSISKNKKAAKKLALSAAKEGAALANREGLKKWTGFYKRQLRDIASWQ